MKSNKANLFVFLVIAIVFLLVEAKGLFLVTPGDENVYFYMAKSVSEGLVPYKDFFYAHPPLHVLILAALIKVFGLNFVILKSATLLACLAAAFFLYKTSLELFENRLNDKNAVLMSALAVVLFLFSFEVMFKATFSMGINFSLMFLMASFYFTFTKKYFAGGILAGLAGLTRFYTLFPLFAVFAFVFIKKIQEKKIRDFAFMLLGFLLTFGVAIGILALVFGDNFIDPVFKYHLLKPKIPNQKNIVYKSVLKENWIVLFPFLLSLFIKNKKRFQLFYFVVFAYLLFLAFLNVIEEFYFSMAFPFMAIIGAYTIVEMARSIKLQKYLKYTLIFALAAVFLWNTTADTLFLEKYGFLEFKPLNEMASKISSTDPSLKIFGDDSIAPLLGMMANRKLALNYIDTNEMRFSSGITNFYIFTSQLDGVNLSYIILRQSKGINQIVELRQYANKRCRLDSTYSDIIEGEFLLYDCRK